MLCGGAITDLAFQERLIVLGGVLKSGESAQNDLESPGQTIEFGLLKVHCFTCRAYHMLSQSFYIKVSRPPTMAITSRAGLNGISPLSVLANKKKKRSLLCMKFDSKLIVIGIVKP